MDAGLIIYFLKDPGLNINFKVLDSQDIYFKKLPLPPPSSQNQRVRPQTKKGPLSTIPQ